MVFCAAVVPTSGSTVTIQPLTWIQNGLIVDSDQPLSVTLSGVLQPPYFVAVTSSSEIENLAEVITPTFVKRPEDVSSGVVLVAEFDGTEWRPLPQMDLGQILMSRNLRAIGEGLVGVSSGFGVSQDSGHLYVLPGAAHATDGSYIQKMVTTILPKVAAPGDGFNRIDEVVLRKPSDSPARIATVDYIVGPTFDSSGAPNVLTPHQLASSVASAAKTINDPATNALYFFYIIGSGSGATLNFVSAPADLSSFTSPQVLATNLSSFSVIMTPDGFLDTVYTRGTAVLYQRTTTAGASVYAETTIYTNPNAITNVKMVSVAAGATYFLHVVFERFVSVSQTDLGYVRLSSTNTVETPFQVLVSLSAVLKNPSLDKNDDDSTFYLAFENQSTQKVYLRVYDAGTATASAIPTELGMPLELQGNTYDLSSASLLAATGATMPIVKCTANKEIYVFWLHFKSAGVYGVAVYNVHYQQTFGYMALVKDLYTPSENVKSVSRCSR